MAVKARGGAGSKAASSDSKAAGEEGGDGSEWEEVVITFPLSFLPPLPFTLSLSLSGDPSRTPLATGI